MSNQRFFALVYGLPAPASRAAGVGERRWAWKMTGALPHRGRREALDAGRR